MLIHLLEGLVRQKHALSVYYLMCSLPADIRVALKRQLRWVYVLIIATNHLILFKDHLLLLRVSVHGIWRKNNTWLPNDSNSCLNMTTDILPHTNLRVIATSRGL